MMDGIAKRVAVAVVLLCLAGCCRAPCSPSNRSEQDTARAAQESVRLFPTNPHGKWGYIDASGTGVIEPRFAAASFFKGGRAWVAFGAPQTREGPYAFIDAHGVTTPTSLKSVLAVVGRGDGTWWCRYGVSPDDPMPFKSKDRLWGLRRGAEIVAAPAYYDISRFGGGLAHAHRAHEYVYLDRTGRVVWEPRYPLDLGEADWQFDKQHADLKAAIAAHRGPYEFKMVLPPIPEGMLPLPGPGGTLEVWKGEERVARISCQTTTGIVFVMSGGTLYYADPAGCTTGCVAGAVNLENGEHLWRTSLKALWPNGINHSMYSNDVNLRLDRGHLIVSACEMHGEYVEALDPETGAIAGRCVR